jgi:hypothetical protein
VKIISIANNYENHTDNTITPAAYIIPDSGILKDGKPFFIPGFAETFTFYPSLIVRINRLGKNISAKFAHRYYDAVTLGLTVHAEDIGRHFSDAGLPGAIANAFDGAAILGEFNGIEKFSDINDLKLITSINGKTVSEFNTGQMVHNIDFLIEYLSKYFTLKIGDLIYTGSPHESKQTLSLNQLITASINDTEVLNFKTK